MTLTILVCKKTKGQILKTTIDNGEKGKCFSLFPSVSCAQSTLKGLIYLLLQVADMLPSRVYFVAQPLLHISTLTSTFRQTDRQYVTVQTGNM